LGIPSSSSHALIGGVIGSTIAAAGGHAIQWHNLFAKVIIPAGLSPVIAALVAASGTYLLYRISRSLTEGARTHGFRIGQIGSASMVSLAHGTNDAQKTMGVITLALIVNGTLPASAGAPFWVILACGLAISLGTFVGGWRVIRTLGKGLVEIEPPQGMAAESASAAVILLSSHFGYSLSTTHVATGCGSPAGRTWPQHRRLVNVVIAASSPSYCRWPRPASSIVAWLLSFGHRHAAFSGPWISNALPGRFRLARTHAGHKRDQNSPSGIVFEPHGAAGQWLASGGW
jgi:phosphate/sulfate permease